ncbi:hypothetical protein AB0I77_48040 [Streptomyces sp. NPDC050619]|uniref:hypothetical protein n=1 Tax=Streptomyces sp. NPDC050619 TaxID=3157214 RepID=UPI00342F2442
MTTPPYEVLANDTTLLTFDGRVLELFGFGDAHRPHIWQEPRLEFGTGRKPRMGTVIGQPGVSRRSLPYDPERGVAETATLM